MIKIKLTPKRCMYPKVYDPDNNFYIYSCKTDSKEVEKHPKYGTFSIKGEFQRLELDVEYTAELEVGEVDPTFGTSYIVHNIFQEMPKTAEAQKEFFRALITEKQIREIFKVYADHDVIELFKNDELDYNKIKGFGETTYKKVRKKILDNLDYQELFTQLGRYGITYGVIVKLMDEFGSAELAIQKVKNNPYELTKIQGIGFIKADAIARNMAKDEIQVLLDQGDITRDEANRMFVDKVFKSPFRIQSGIKYILEMEQGNGHTYIDHDELLKKGQELLQIEIGLIDNQIFAVDFLYVNDSKVALLATYEQEKYIAEWIKERLQINVPLNFNVDEFIKRMEIKYKDILKHGLSDQQKAFFYNIKNESVNLLVGFAGTGKSLLQLLLKELLQELGFTSKWLAPTGSAAKILSEYIQDKASTVHKAIGYGKKKDDKDLVEIHEDYLIIDEVSLLDVFVCSSALKKIKNPSTRVLFIGDPFQIPSVMAGNILQNMIESKIIPITMLDVVFRQGEGGLLDVITKIRKGEKFVDNDFTGYKKFGDNFILHCVDQEWMVDGYRNYYHKLLKMFKPDEIMVLSPTKKGDLGTVSINTDIQSIVNPPDASKKEVEYSEDGVLRVGDYVMNVKNTYNIENVNGDESEIVNGDKGYIYDIITDWKKRDRFYDSGLHDDEEEEKDLNGIYIHFDNDDIQLSLQDKGQLLHGWCPTMHKSQGGSANAVLAIADKAHTFQLTANLLYTALTRARQYGILLSQAQTINRALKKFENLRRNTFLCELLVGE